MTAEELAIIAQLIKGEKVMSDFQQKPAAPPPDLAAPYNDQAAKYNTEADSLERDMATPYPQPHGVKENVIAGIRSGMQDFGRLGVPGGSTGQEMLRQKQFNEENAMRLDRVKSLRSGAAQQQQMGQTKVFQTGELENQTRNVGVNEGNLKVSQQNADRLQGTEDRIAKAGQEPQYSPVQPGQPVMKTAPGQEPAFLTAPGSKPAAAPHDPKTVETAEGVLQYMPDTDSWKRIGGNKPAASTYSQASGSYGTLAPDLKTKVDAVADKVASGEYTASNGLSALGGVRGGLGGALTEALSDRRVLPTAVRTANSDIERAKNLLVPVKRLIAEIDKTPDLQQKAVKSVQLEQYVQAIGTQFARARGERGVVTDKDVERVLGLIPGWKSANFAPEYAQRNLALVEEAFNRDQESLFGKYFTQVPIDGSGGAPPSSGGTSVVPGGAVERLLKGIK